MWVLTNDAHVHFRIASFAGRPTNGATVWRLDDVLLRGIAAFRDHLAVTERVDGLDQIRLRSYDGGEKRIPFTEASYAVGLGENPEYAPSAYRLSYSSLVTPPTVYDYHPAEDRLETRKVQRIPSGYDPSRYVSERLMLPTRDGKRVPVAIVYRRGFERNGRGRVFLYAYGPTLAIPRLQHPASACSTALRLRHRHSGGDDLGYQLYLDASSSGDPHLTTSSTRPRLSPRFTPRRQHRVQAAPQANCVRCVNSDPELWARGPDVPSSTSSYTSSRHLPLPPGEWNNGAIRSPPRGSNICALPAV